MVSVGTLNKAIVHPREVFKTAILSNAASIMAFHNHPSGETTPSQQDIQLTNRLYEAGELLEYQVVRSSHYRRWNIYIIKRKRLFIRS